MCQCLILHQGELDAFGILLENKIASIDKEITINKD
jgi:hypothetical protein